MLTALPCRDWMTTKIVVAKPEETIEQFMERTLLEHSFRELPVVTDQGIFRGMVSARAMKSVPRHEWGTAESPESSIGRPQRFAAPIRWQR